MNVEQRMREYVGIREILRAEAKVWKEREKLLTSILDRIEGEFHAFLKATGQTNLVAQAGTCYTTEVWTATVADAEAFQKFVKETGRMDLLKMSANPLVVKAFVETTKTLPTGVTLSSKINVNVRKAAEAKPLPEPVTERTTP